MTAPPRFPAEEIARRGEALYEREIHQKVEAEHTGKTLVLDIDSGDFEIDADHFTALRRARAKKPDATPFALCIGYPALARIGGKSGAWQ